MRALFWAGVRLGHVEAVWSLWPAPAEAASSEGRGCQGPRVPSLDRSSSPLPMASPWPQLLVGGVALLPSHQVSSCLLSTGRWPAPGLPVPALGLEDPLKDSKPADCGLRRVVPFLGMLCPKEPNGTLV